MIHFSPADSSLACGRAAASGTATGYLPTSHGRLDFSRRTAIMAILNLTPDSFYDGGRRLDPGKAIADGIEMAEAGADVIDIGGESTRPGARPVSEDEELERVLPVVRGLRRGLSIPISIDTYKSGVARAALCEGADIVNDISALRFDTEMGGLVAAEKVPVILMHMQGTPRTMQAAPRYDDVVRDVGDFLAVRIQYAVERGVQRDKIVVDPGFGFGKTLEHNLALLRGLSALAALGQPLLAGVSRKTFIGKILDLEPAERLEGSLAAAVVAVLGGANIIRGHDVKETCRAVRIADAIRFGVRE